MDLDRLLQRHPDVALVDELAHTNVPGSRHKKRWQDVEELLEAGINVISTVNVQHLESLNDVVERITASRSARRSRRRRARRRPDRARGHERGGAPRRMAHGNVYPPEKVDAALGNYFREGNLAALRSWPSCGWPTGSTSPCTTTASRHGIAMPWETRERVIVAIEREGRGEHLIRRGARMAARTKATSLPCTSARPTD